MKKNLFILFASLVAVFLSSCNKPQPTVDPRDAFVGEYFFTSDGSVDMYAGAIKVGTVPLGNEGDMTLKLSADPGKIWVLSEGDSIAAYVAGNCLFMEPDSNQYTFQTLLITLAFSYGKATLENNVLNIPADVSVNMDYKGLELQGNGHIDVVATKK